MPITGLTCYLDDLPLNASGETLRSKASESRARTTRIAVGEHVHLETPGVYECANGHRWEVHGDLIATRVR